MRRDPGGWAPTFGPRWAWAAAAACACWLHQGGALAAGSSGTLPGVTIGISTGQGAGSASTTVEILLGLTVLSLAPAVLLLMTSFTRIVVVLSFARNALATGQLPPNQVIVGLALFLTLFVMGPTFSAIYRRAWVPYQAGTLSAGAAVQVAEGPLRTFMLRQTRPADLGMFERLAAREQSGSGTGGSTAGTAGSAPAGASGPGGAGAAASRGGGTTAAANAGSAATGAAATASAGAAGVGGAAPPLSVLVPAFVISELKTAFEMGFILFIPFVVIDLVVGSTLMAAGMMMLPPMLISLPFKILLFVLVDGWSLLVQSLVLSFH